MALNYSKRGKGIPLVLLHGFPFNHSIWEDVIGNLNEGICTVTPDLLSHVVSDADSANYTISAMANSVINLLEILQIEKAVIAGHSMGGYVALEITRKNPKRLIGLVLIASHIYADSSEKRKSRLDQIERVKEIGPAQSLRDMPDVLTNDPLIRDKCRTYIDRANPAGVIGALNAMAHRRSSEKLWRSTETPTMVIAGEDDKVIPFVKCREFALLSKHNTFVKIEKAGHIPMIEAPARVAGALQEFIEEILRR